MDNAMYNAIKNIPTYSTEGNLRDRGYPSSYDGGIGARVEVNDYSKTKTPTGGGKTSTGSTSSSSGSYDMSSYLSDLYAQRQAAAEAAYERSMGLLNDAYNSAANNYADIFNRGQDTLRGAYDNSRNKINEQASDSMREAYINRMLSMKNLSQKLAAMGISGGASESTVAGLLNNYGNARNGIQKTWNNNLADLEQGFNSNLTDLYNAYQSQMAELANTRAAQQAQLVSNLNNQIASAGSDFFSILSNPNVLKAAASGALQNLQSIQPVATEATNTYNPVNTQQSNDMGGTLTNYSREEWEKLANGGSGVYDRIQKLLAQGVPDETLASMLTGYRAS